MALLFCFNTHSLTDQFNSDYIIDTLQYISAIKLQSASDEPITSSGSFPNYESVLVTETRV